MTRRLLCVFSLLIAVSFLPAAEADPPKEGQAAPDLQLTTLDGTTVSLADKLKRGPVVVVMLRGFPGYQCPLCSFQVGGLVNNAEKFAEHQAQVVLVYPGSASELDQRAQEFLGKAELPAGFDLVTDPNYSMTLAWNLRWDAPRETAYPSTFVIGQDGKVRYAKVSRTHGGRARVADILQALSSKQG